MTILSRRLRETRRRLGLKQGELAQALGVTQGTISRWETGGQSPDLAAMAKLAEIAGYDQASFILSEDTHPFIAQNKGIFVDVVGQVAEGSWIEKPEWEKSQQFQMQIPMHYEWQNSKIEGFLVADHNFEPVFNKESIVFIEKLDYEESVLYSDDYVVVQRLDDRGLFEVVVRQVYINNKGETYLTTIPIDPSIGNAFKITNSNDTTIGGYEGIIKIDYEAIRGTVVASFRIEMPYLRMGRHL